MDREQVLQELQRRIGGTEGKLLTTVKALADELGIKPERLYYLIRSFEKKGQIATTSHGPKGMEFRVGSGEAKAAAAPRARGRVAAAPSGRRSGASRFCPWCGHAVETGWHFCPACGDKLPQVG